MADKPEKVWRHTAQVQRMFGQTESATLTLTFDTVEQLRDLYQGITSEVFEPKQAAVEAKMEEINNKLRESAKKGKE